MSGYMGGTLPNMEGEAAEPYICEMCNLTVYGPHLCHRPNSLAELRKEIKDYGNYSPEYFDKMVHRIPRSTVVDRVKFILDRCKGKQVLNLGSDSGPLHEMIKGVASELTGVDKHDGPNTQITIDLDKSPYMYHTNPDRYHLIVCGELLEHLANPGRFLEAMRHFQCPMLITSPNAFCEAGLRSVKRGTENVNKDHVAYYSYKTLKTLVERYGYKIQEFHWYHGKPNVAEGLIAIVG